MRAWIKLDEVLDWIDQREGDEEEEVVIEKAWVEDLRTMIALSTRKFSNELHSINELYFTSSCYR